MALTDPVTGMYAIVRLHVFLRRNAYVRVISIQLMRYECRRCMCGILRAEGGGRAEIHELESATAFRADGRCATISNDRGLLAFA